MENPSFNPMFAPQAMTPVITLWQSFWQRYVDNSTKMMSIWMTLPFEMMASVRSETPVSQAYEQASDTYGSALRETTALSQDTAAAAVQAVSKTKDRVSQ
ncbi:MAG: hypothetical protein K2P80_12955 [Beijerinckiaceae bacterium]|nr:hypothetical protein [Beijerinckiaceae bacterium]